MTPTVIFWYEFASTYSYLTAMRIETEAARAGVKIEWRPFLLGPIFKAQGWTTSPFNIYPAKGKYMIRDVGRTAHARGISFTMPQVFPVNGLKAARLAIAANDFDATPAFTRAAYEAQFAHGRDIADDAVLRDCVLAASLDPDAIVARSGDDGVKDELRSNTDKAIAAGIFGAPSITTSDGELFWGDDRLEQALAWARTHHVTSIGQPS